MSAVQTTVTDELGRWEDEGGAPSVERSRRFEDIADAYHQNVVALRAGRITADEHRAENHRLRESVDEATWLRVKATVLEYRDLGSVA